MPPPVLLEYGAQNRLKSTGTSRLNFTTNHQRQTLNRILAYTFICTISGLHQRVELYDRLSLLARCCLLQGAPSIEVTTKACFPLGEFVRANRESSNLIGW